jgi:hypothetical protein
MKTLLLVTLLVISTNLYACVDLSGTFITADGLSYTVIQNECTEMIVSDTSTRTIIFDNVEQLIYEYDVESNGKIEHLQLLIRSVLKDNKWIYNERIVNVSAEGSIEIDHSWSEVFLNVDKNIVTITHKANGSVEKYLDVRISPLDSLN